MTDTKDKIENTFKILERFDHYIEIANSKATTQISFLITLIVGITALLGYCEVLNLNKAKILASIILVLFTILVALNFFAFYQLSKVILPDTRNLANTSSLIFYGDISQHPYSTNYVTLLKSISEEDFLADLGSQTHTLAIITNAKFSKLISATQIILYGIAPISIVIVILTAILKALGGTV